MKFKVGQKVIIQGNEEQIKEQNMLNILIKKHIPFHNYYKVENGMVGKIVSKNNDSIAFIDFGNDNQTSVLVELLQPYPKAHNENEEELDIEITVKVKNNKVVGNVVIDGEKHSFDRELDEEDIMMLDLLTANFQLSKLLGDDK